MWKPLMFALLFLPSLAQAGIVAKYPLSNGNWLGQFDINGTEVWQVILGVIKTPEVHADKLTLKQTIEQHIKTMADWYGVSRDTMFALYKCESGFGHPDVTADKAI